MTLLRLAAKDGVRVDADGAAANDDRADVASAIERLRHLLPVLRACGDFAVLMRTDVAAALLADRDAKAGREGALHDWVSALLDVAHEAGVRVDGAVEADLVATRIRAELQRLRELAAFQALQIEDLQAVLNERAAR